jgi:hypothetical protein
MLSSFESGTAVFLPKENRRFLAKTAASFESVKFMETI